MTKAKKTGEQREAGFSFTRNLKTTNRQLRERNRKLIEAEAMKEDLINMVAHDMKNPVNNAMLGLDMVEFDPGAKLTERQSDSLQLVRRNLFRLSEMIMNLLEISGLESGRIDVKKADLDTKNLIDGVVGRQTANMGIEGKTIEISVDSGAESIVGDERLLDRILSNILSNAIKHSYAGTKVSIRVVCADKDGAVLFRIQDSGEGIPKKYHKKIFERFFQIEMRRLGHRNDTGLGLAFCKMAVEALGGRIWVESEPGKGSCFTFSLPDALLVSKVR